MEIDERGRKRLPEDVREESALIQATTEEEEVERMRKEAEKAEKQRWVEVHDFSVFREWQDGVDCCESDPY